jgi:galactose mutarotase-like enzyme
VALGNGLVAVEVAALGAEMQSIRSADGANWLWHGDPAFWSGRAPLLFPVIGKSPGNEVTLEGHAYPMLGHGFARNSRFDVVTAEPERCTLQLRASPATRLRFPREFELNVSYGLEGMGLRIDVNVVNTDTRTMPVCFGFHPAFAWPLPGCRADELHVCVLDGGAEPPIRRLDASGLLLPGQLPSPFKQGVLPLDHALFAHDAILIEEGAGPTVHYGVPGRPGIEVSSVGLPQLGLWSKPGAPFLCIEPWQGMAPERDGGPALENRPGVTLLAPGRTHSVSMLLRFGATVPTA